MKQCKKKYDCFTLLHPENEGILILQNVRNYTPNNHVTSQKAEKSMGSFRTSCKIINPTEIL